MMNYFNDYEDILRNMLNTIVDRRLRCFHAHRGRKRYSDITCRRLKNAERKGELDDNSRDKMICQLINALMKDTNDDRLRVILRACSSFAVLSGCQDVAVIAKYVRYLSPEQLIALMESEGSCFGDGKYCKDVAACPLSGTCRAFSFGDAHALYVWDEVAVNNTPVSSRTRPRPRIRRHPRQDGST